MQGTQFTCFTSTKVQILTPNFKCRRVRGAGVHRISYCHICALILLNVCPHTAKYVSSYELLCMHPTRAGRALCGMHTNYYYTCVLILTAIYSIRVRVLCGMHAGVYMCRHTSVCVLIPLYVSSCLCIYMCPHTSLECMQAFHRSLLALLVPHCYKSTNTDAACGRYVKCMQACKRAVATVYSR
jgi:hypothetical protein